MILSHRSLLHVLIAFLFNDTATTAIYTLSLHDALPISPLAKFRNFVNYYGQPATMDDQGRILIHPTLRRSEEHTSELQSRQYLVCRLLLEKKKQTHLSAPQLRKYKTMEERMTELRTTPK